MAFLLGGGGLVTYDVLYEQHFNYGSLQATPHVRLIVLRTCSLTGLRVVAYYTVLRKRIHTLFIKQI